jgi:hypothetical protein
MLDFAAFMLEFAVLYSLNCQSLRAPPNLLSEPLCVPSLRSSPCVIQWQSAKSLGSSARSDLAS